MHPKTFRSLAQRSVAALCVVLTFPAVLMLAGCGQDEDLPAARTGTPVILISIDTLRSDRLPAYGYEGVETPAIDAFRRDSVLFENAYSHVPLTLPAHGSMLTGLLPAGHGIRDNVGFVLGEEIQTLPEIMGGAGYETGGVISAFVLRRETGIDQGFDFYEDTLEPDAGLSAIGEIQRPGDESAALALDWAREREKPYFLFLHLYDPHTPYRAPEPYLSRYHDRYDGEIAWTDEVLGDFFAGLKSAGLYDEALIILTSDHGEGLMEHGEAEHGIFLYREAIQVPLIVKLPDSKLGGKSRSGAVQLADIVPTVLERTGIGITQDLDGISLFGVQDSSEEPRRIYSESQYARFHYGWSDVHSLIDGTHHYIHVPEPELYDLRDDFGETRNVLKENRRIYAAMRDQIEPMATAAVEAPGNIDPEAAAKLAALGYLGSTVKTEPGEALADPKHKIESLRRIQRAFDHYKAAEYVETVEETGRLLDENPKLVDLWTLRMKSLAHLGRDRDAIEAGKQALTLAPHATHTAFELADLMFKIGDLEGAEAHANLAVEAHPAPAYGILARVAMERGELDRAEELAQVALENNRFQALSLVLMGRIERERGNLEKALAYLDEALEVKREDRLVSELHLTRGDVLARLGRAREAEVEFRKEIELFPERIQAYRNLIVLLVAQGRIQEGTQLIYQLIEANPTPPGYIAVIQTLDTLGDEKGARYWATRGAQKFPGDEALRRLAS